MTVCPKKSNKFVAEEILQKFKSICHKDLKVHYFEYLGNNVAFDKERYKRCYTKVLEI